MALPDDKVQITVVLDKDIVNVLDMIAAEADIPRTRVIAGCVECGLEDLKMLAFFGLTPRRLRLIVEKLRKVGLFKSGDVEIDFSCFNKTL